MPRTAHDADPNRISDFRTPTDAWSVPVFRFGPVRVTLSYLVFAVAAIVIGIALTEARYSGDQGVIPATGIAIAFWVSGWIGQALAYAGIAKLIGSPVDHLPIGILGVKAVARKWSPSSALVASLGTIASLLALGTLYRLIEVGSRLPQVPIEPASIWTAPSIGLTKIDSPWLAGAWLCWSQVVLQTLPLAQSLGQQLLASLIGLSPIKPNLDFRIRVLRYSLAAIAMVMIGSAIWLYINGNFPIWTVILGLGFAVWVTSKGKQPARIMLGFQRYVEQDQQVRMSESARQLFQARQGRRRAKQALQRERSEAMDAARLDEVLAQLHRGGADSLRKEDRELLQRVSERVRKARDAGSSSG